MKSVIERLFYGEIDSFESFRWTDEYKMVTKEFTTKEEELIKLLSEADREIYDKLMDVKLHCFVVEAKIHFSYGLKLGFKLANEILEKKKV
ncbi:DUF6809 family protein [Clostridiisalibacter paucivorans]|uniref:DUF6809 family protein n=1 Tax=Clostridiisalibacter paucivorans TaxID=408753 RepID=UPI00047DFAE1|nr:DUF6809 family protein [Clostridiisalibacter paucivorans]